MALLHLHTHTLALEIHMSLGKTCQCRQQPLVFPVNLLGLLPRTHVTEIAK